MVNLKKVQKSQRDLKPMRKQNEKHSKHTIHQRIGDLGVRWWKNCIKIDLT